MNILLGVSGSVAARLAPKLYGAFNSLGDVTTIATSGGGHFLPSDFKYLSDKDEWDIWESEGRVLHIDLRKMASVLVIAPLSADVLAKMAGGICDGLLTSVVRAWDRNRYIVVAPAMNTYMWENPLTSEHLRKIREVFPNLSVVYPVEKALVCGDVGVGAMAGIDQIVTAVRRVLRWRFPLGERRCVPSGDHPGAFGFSRKFDVHTGVDLYCDVEKENPVFAVETGTVVKVGCFTGSSDNTPWWNDTKYMMVEGASGVVNYGEILPHEHIRVGMSVSYGQEIGKVVPVLREGKERPDIPGHSRAMLHIELYKHGVRDCDVWKHGEPQPKDLLDPTSLLLGSV